MDETNGPALTHPAKEAIRGYMMKLVAIPALAATVLSFFLGFGINELARGAAYNSAVEAYSGRFESYSQKVVDQALLIGSAQATVNRLIQDANDSKSKASDALIDIVDKSAKIKTIFNENAEGIAKVLTTDPKFVSLLGKASSVEVANLSDKIDDLRAKLQEQLASINIMVGTSTASSTEPLNDGGGTKASCPQGAFITGLQLYKGGDGVRTINVDCGILPSVSIE